MVRELRHEGDVWQDFDVDLLHPVPGAVLAERTLKRGDVQCDADDTPERARPTLFTVGIERVQLDDLTTGRYNHAVAVGEQLLTVVTDDAQVDHLAGRLGTGVG